MRPCLLILFAACAFTAPLPRLNALAKVEIATNIGLMASHFAIGTAAIIASVKIRKFNKEQSEKLEKKQAQTANQVAISN